MLEITPALESYHPFLENCCPKDIEPGILSLHFSFLNVGLMLVIYNWDWQSLWKRQIVYIKDFVSHAVCCQPLCCRRVKAAVDTTQIHGHGRRSIKLSLQNKQRARFDPWAIVCCYN